MYVNEEARVVYLANPRTASVATAQALVEHAGFGPKTQHGHHQKLTERFSDYRILTTVRNPFDAVASLWFHWNRPTPFGRPFVEWCYEERAPYFPERGRWFALHLPPRPPDNWTVLRYESLQVGLNRALDAFGLPPAPLPRANVGKERAGIPYQHLWDGQSLPWFKATFSEELRILSYGWERLS